MSEKPAKPEKPTKRAKRAKAVPKKEKPKGRATKLTPQVQEGIINSIRLGNYQDHASLANGISVSTFYNWLERGKKERERIEDLELSPNPKEALYLDFLEAVEKAKAEAIQRNVGIIQKAASIGSWQAAAWYLERTVPTIYGRKQQVALQGVENGAPVQVTVDTKDLEDKVSRILQIRD